MHVHRHTYRPNLRECLHHVRPNPACHDINKSSMSPMRMLHLDKNRLKSTLFVHCTTSACLSNRIPRLPHFVPCIPTHSWPIHADIQLMCFVFVRLFAQQAVAHAPGWRSLHPRCPGALLPSVTIFVCRKPRQGSFFTVSLFLWKVFS